MINISDSRQNTCFKKFYLCFSSQTKILTCVLILLTCTACAHQPSHTNENEEGIYEQADENIPSVVSYDDYQDPLEPVNRVIFKFNDVTYRYFLTPVSAGYNKLVPPAADRSISNFFNNILEPVNSLNNLLQGKPGKAGTNLLRLGINSTVGVLGLFDPAEHWWDISPAKSDFSYTLAYHGAGYGVYIVFPLLGPSDLRDTTSRVAGYFTYPLQYVKDTEDYAAYVQLYQAFHNNSTTFEQYPEVLDPSQDPYIFMRNLYLQSVMRDADIVNPEQQPTGLSGRQDSE